MRRESWAALGVVLAVLATASFTACGKKNETPTVQTAPPQPAEERTASPESQRYMQAAEPFVRAVANRRYDEAHGLLSGHAKSRMTLNQFVAPPDALTLQRDQQSPFADVTAQSFAELMKRVEELYGLPQSVKSLAVFSVEPAVLARRSPEESAALDSADAIGAMPDSIPGGIRRASLHGEITTQLTSDQLQHLAAGMDVQPEELRDDPDFKPSFNVKLVLVEEDGQLKVGYFEFLPASRWN